MKIYLLRRVSSCRNDRRSYPGNGQAAIAPGTTPPDNPIQPMTILRFLAFLGQSNSSVPTDSAKETAVKVNNLTGQSGVKAYAKTYVSYSATTAKTYSVNINGYETGNFAIAEGDAESQMQLIRSPDLRA